VLTLLPSSGKQFFTRLDVSSQEELDAFRKTPNHPAIIVYASFLVGDPKMPEGGTANCHLVISDDEPITFRRESGNQAVYGYQKSKRHKIRWHHVSLCLDEKQHEELMAKSQTKHKDTVNARLAKDPLAGCVTVASLKAHFDEHVPLCDQHTTLVVLSTDSEGNSYSPVGSVDTSYKDPDGYVAAPSQTFKDDAGRTRVIYVEFVPREPGDLDGRHPAQTPDKSRRNAVVLYPVN
jgi:hypothetical protein